MEFLARLGPGFLSAYHRAWIASPSGLALAAVDADHNIVGVILASLDPASHYRWMLVHAGPKLAIRLAAQSVRKPALARDLIATRAARYASAVWRQLATPTHLEAAATSSSRSGEVTHLMVTPEAQGAGAGAALLAHTERRANAAGLQELVLVTPPGLDSRHFYEHLGWEATGQVTSRSGEHFIRFTRRLGARAGAPKQENQPGDQDSALLPGSVVRREADRVDGIAVNLAGQRGSDESGSHNLGHEPAVGQFEEEHQTR